MANSFWELVHPHLKSKRVFDPSIDLIKSTFTNVYTRKFLKDCIKISKSDPGLIKLEPDHGYPPSEDIDKLNTFLYLYNASLREEWWLDKNKNKKYYIELYDDPE